MNRAIALAQPFAVSFGRIDSLDLARRIIVVGSAAALILAGQAFPL